MREMQKPFIHICEVWNKEHNELENRFFIILENLRRDQFGHMRIKAIIFDTLPKNKRNERAFSFQAPFFRAAENYENAAHALDLYKNILNK